MSNGIIYSAYGKQAIDECLRSIHSVQQKFPNLGTCVITDSPIPLRLAPDKVIEFESDPFGRWAKLNADILTPFKNTLYLDADTRVHGNIFPIFNWLEEGFEFITTLSARQGDEWNWQVPIEEKEASIEQVGFVPVQMQGGVWAFRRTPKVRSYFAQWRKEWKSYNNKHDQAAMSRAIRQRPMKTLIIGTEFNGGAIIQHLFGRAERK